MNDTERILFSIRCYAECERWRASQKVFEKQSNLNDNAWNSKYYNFQSWEKGVVLFLR